jgi:hypothetical protein
MVGNMQREKREQLEIEYFGKENTHEKTVPLCMNHKHFYYL